jgi:hypothetical protein
MNDQPESKPGPVKPAQTAAGSATAPPTDSSSAVQPADPTAPNKLSAEDQMAAFEKALKEEDWGHQPC